MIVIQREEKETSICSMLQEPQGSLEGCVYADELDSRLTVSTEMLRIDFISSVQHSSRKGEVAVAE